MPRTVVAAMNSPSQRLCRNSYFRLKSICFSILPTPAREPSRNTPTLCFASTHHVPETEIHVEAPRRQAVEIEARGFIVGARWTDPYRHEFYGVVVERKKFFAMLNGNLDILDYGLGANAEKLVEIVHQLPAAVPTHDFRVGDRIQPLATIEPSHYWILRQQIFGAPEPVSVPAPDIVRGRKVVLGTF